MCTHEPNKQKKNVAMKLQTVHFPNFSFTFPKKTVHDK